MALHMQDEKVGVGLWWQNHLFLQGTPGAPPPQPASLSPCLALPWACSQIGVGVVVAELQRKNKEDSAKKEKEAAEKQAIKELHERHLATETVRGCAVGAPRVHLFMQCNCYRARNSTAMTSSAADNAGTLLLHV